MASYVKFIILFAIILTSCRDKIEYRVQRNGSTLDYEALISHSSGDMWDHFNSSNIGTFFNIGSLDENDFEQCQIIFAGKKLRVGKKISFEPLALIEIYKDSVDYKYVIAKNKRDSDFGIKSKDYLEFSLNQIKFKNLLEQWLLTNCDIGSCSDLVWKNDFKARSYIESKRKEKN